jgi:glycosyltransferase involved in cell wall biosynthesis
MARPLGLHTVLQLHGADFFDFHAALPGPARWALRACIGGADCIVVMGAQWRDRVVAELGMPQSRIRVVPNGAPGSPMAARGGNPARILFLGRLGDRKGVPELVQALASPQLAARDWRAMIAGDGDLAALETRLTATGLRARVDAPGWLDSAEAARALDQTDILVLPSHHEVMPIAILEAMARGLAIVATPVGVIPEILTDNINGRLVPPGDASSLVEALSALLDEPALRHRLGERARETFAARLDIAIPAATLQAIYRQLDARSRRGPGRRMASACPSDLT